MRVICRLAVVAVVISLLTTITHNSARASTVETVEIIEDPGPPPSCKRIVTHDVSAAQLIVGAIVTVAIVKIIFGSPGAFYNVEPPPGWTYDTDGETYLNLYPPAPITSPGSWTFSWESLQPDTRKFSWKTFGAGGILLEQGPVTGPSCGYSLPTLSEWLLIVLALSVGAFFVWQLMRRRRESVA